MPCLMVFSFVFSLTAGIAKSYVSATELWTHFKGVAPTLTEKGTREYWVSCSTYEHVFEEPTGVTIREGETLSRSFVNSLPANDDRLVPYYTEIMGFEDGNVPTYVTAKQNIKSLTIENDGIEGNKCLKILVTGSDYGVYFDKAYLDAIFADPAVVAINFDAKGSIASSNFRAKIAGSNITYEQNNSSYGLDTQWKKFSFKRSYYNSYVSGDAMIFGGGFAYGNYVLVDNIIPVTRDLDSYGFENGYLNTSGKSYYSSGHSNSEPAPVQLFRYKEDTTIVTEMAFDYENKTEGNRALKITKNTGYVAFYLTSNMKTTLGDNGKIKFDFYSTIPINANPSVKNATDGMNNPLGGDGYQIPANTWVSYEFDASNFTTDGRFFILQGSTAGTMYFDNLRISYHYSSLNISQLNRNIFIDSSSDSTLFPTKEAPKEVNSFRVDGNLVNNSNITGIDNNGVYVSNTFLSTLSAGDHKFVLSYFYNGDNTYDETYYQNVYFGTEKAAVSVTTSYGSSEYYTLPDSYTNLYRIVANGMEIPFERVDNGSTYKVPYASLIEALPTVNNQKSSGTITLFIFTINQLYRLPITVNLSTANAKSITEYDGEQMLAFYYSSTSQSYTASSEYETYLSTDKLNECINTGVDVLYEQYLHVGANHTSLTSQLQYLLNNAALLGKKVILSDDAFTLLCRQTVSLIGNDVTVGSETLHFNSTAELDAYVTNRLNIYINNSAVYGVNIGDEENYNQLIHGYSDLMHSIHRCLETMNREDFYLNCNLQPMSATTETMTGNTTGSGDVDTDYRTYLNAYIQASGNDYISYDYYPIVGGNAYDKKGIGPYTLRNLILVAQVAKENGLKVHVVTQTYSPAHSSNTLILNSEDVAYLNNMFLAYGVDQISYFTFYHRGSAMSESWNADGCVMTADGQRNDLYYYMQAQRAQIRYMSPIMSNFEFEWCYIDRYSTSLINPSAYSYLYSNKPYSNRAYQQLSTWSVNKSWINLTGLYNADTNQYMYTVQNLHKNSSQQSATQSISLRFSDTDITYFAVYEGGSVRIVNATTYSSYKQLTVTLSTGHTVFVVPYH